MLWFGLKWEKRWRDEPIRGALTAHPTRNRFDARICTLSTSFCINSEAIHKYWVAGSSVLTSDGVVCGAGMSSAVEVVIGKLETPLFWLGALTAALASVRLVCWVLSGIKVWVLGNGRLMSPTKLGKWAGEKPFVRRFFPLVPNQEVEYEYGWNNELYHRILLDLGLRFYLTLLVYVTFVLIFHSLSCAICVCYLRLQDYINSHWAKRPKA